MAAPLPVKTFLTAAEELAKRREAKIAESVRYDIHPRNGWVLIRMLALQDEISEGGVMMDRTQSRTLRAEVVEASTKHDGTPSDLEPGDIVIVSAFPLEIEDLEEMTGEKHLVMLRDEEIYARCAVRPTEE